MGFLGNAIILTHSFGGESWNSTTFYRLIQLYRQVVVDISQPVKKLLFHFLQHKAE